jgi:hypothetical protein
MKKYVVFPPDSYPPSGAIYNIMYKAAAVTVICAPFFFWHRLHRLHSRGSVRARKSKKFSKLFSCAHESQKNFQSGFRARTKVKKIFKAVFVRARKSKKFSKSFSGAPESQKNFQSRFPVRRKVKKISKAVFRCAGKSKKISA